MDALKVILTHNLLLLAFVLHCAIVGYALIACLRLCPLQMESSDNNPYLYVFFSQSLGLTINIALLFLLGIAGLLNRYAILIGLVTLLVVCVPVVQSSPRYSVLIRAFKARSAVRFELLSLLLIFLIVSSYAIRVPGSWDDTMYHLPLAKYYINQQGIVLNEYLRFPLFPQNLDLLFVLGLMGGGELLAQGMAALPLFVAIVGLVGTAVWLLGSATPGFVAGFLLLVIRPVYRSLGYAYVDDGLALFCWGALLALALWEKSGRKMEWLAVAGMLAGGAAGTKYFGAVLAGMLLLYVLAVKRDWHGALVYSIIGIVFGSWWYVRSWIISGDPIHPVGGDIFGHFLWNAQDFIGQKQEQAGHGVDRTLFNIFPALAKAGVWLWVPAFLSCLYFRRAEQAVRLFQAVFICYFLFWFFVTQVPRYLAPIYVVGSFLSIYFACKIGLGRSVMALFRRWPSVSKPLGVGALCVLVLVPICVARYWSAILQIEQWEELLQKRGGYALMRRASTLTPQFGDRLVQAGFENAVYFFEGTVIGDHFGPGRYSGMKLDSPSAMIEYMQQFNSRMLVINSKRHPINKLAYGERFDILMTDQYGYLMTIK